MLSQSYWLVPISVFEGIRIRKKLPCVQNPNLHPERTMTHVTGLNTLGTPGIRNRWKAKIEGLLFLPDPTPPPSVLVFASVHLQVNEMRRL